MEKGIIEDRKYNQEKGKQTSGTRCSPNSCHVTGTKGPQKQIAPIRETYNQWGRFSFFPPSGILGHLFTTIG